MRGSRTLLKQAQYVFRAPEMEVDHLVVGGGVIGLAVAARLTTQYPDKSTYLVERNSQIGQETSSRNSEVIHAGIYYPSNSLKSRFCIRGRDMLYERCQEQGIGFKKCQKLVVATNNDQLQYLDRLHLFTQSEQLSEHLYRPSSSSGSRGTPSVLQTGEAVPTYFLAGDEARGLEPDLGYNVIAGMLSTETGIVDAHGLMASLESEIEAGDGSGQIVLGTKVVRVDPYRDESGGKMSGSQNGWVVQTVTEGSDRPDTILAKVLVLSAGLNCVHLLNPLLPRQEQLTAYYSKGSYLSYKGPGVGSVQRLLYPCPQPGLAGLGTHLTLDLAGKIKFGPDVEHLEVPEDADADFWQGHLQPSEHRVEEMYRAIIDYASRFLQLGCLHRATADEVVAQLPNIDPEGLTPDYAGIRPNLSPPGSGFTDFHISYDPSSRPGLVALCGFHSPGLTSSLAVGEEVWRVISKDVWGVGSGKGRVRKVSEVGGQDLDGWA